MNTIILKTMKPLGMPNICIEVAIKVNVNIHELSKKHEYSKFKISTGFKNAKYTAAEKFNVRFEENIFKFKSTAH